jgi:hypothetical protein
MAIGMEIHDSFEFNSCEEKMQYFDERFSNGQSAPPYADPSSYRISHICPHLALSTNTRTTFVFENRSSKPNPVMIEISDFRDEPVIMEWSHGETGPAVGVLCPPRTVGYFVARRLPGQSAELGWARIRTANRDVLGYAVCESRPNSQSLGRAARGRHVEVVNFLAPQYRQASLPFISNGGLLHFVAIFNTDASRSKSFRQFQVSVRLAAESGGDTWTVPVSAGGAILHDVQAKQPQPDVGFMEVASEDNNADFVVFGFYQAGTASGLLWPVAEVVSSAAGN